MPSIEEQIWTIAYFRALTIAPPGDAQEEADDAVLRFKIRWRQSASNQHPMSWRRAPVVPGMPGERDWRKQKLGAQRQRKHIKKR
jgi:hypothetical protein